MGIEIVERRRRDLDIGDAGIAGRDAQQVHLAGLIGHQQDAAVRASRHSRRSSTPTERSRPGARSSETRIGSCEIERSSASVPCATRSPRFMMRTCSARSSSSLSACEEISDGGAVVAQFARGFRRRSGAARGRGRWSARRAAAPAAAPAAPGPGPAAAACPWNRCRPGDRPHRVRPTRSSSGHAVAGLICFSRA